MRLPEDDGAGDFPYDDGGAGNRPDDAYDGTGDIGDDGGPLEPPARRGWPRRIAGWVITLVACLFVIFALLSPNKYRDITPIAFARLPIEALVGVVLVLILPTRVRRVLAGVVGVLLGLMAVEKIADVGFYGVLDRPFDLVLDWAFFGNAVDFLRDSYGSAGAIAGEILTVVLAIVVLLFSILSTIRLSGIVARHRKTATGAVALLGVAWAVCAVLGLEFVAKAPVASTSASDYLYQDVRQVRFGLQDKKTFAKQIAVDPFANTPGDQLLTGLRGKDVLLTFVESYGRAAVEDPKISPGVNKVLAAGTTELRKAGFDSRSGFLTSSTYGGGSWLAHGSTLSGLWIDNQQRHNTLVTSDRLTLPSAFRKANWRTVAVMPGLKKAWSEGDFYGYDKVYGDSNLGYHGPKFGWATMPDQYALATFQRNERANPNHAPLFAEMALVSSHTPWAPIPSMIDWNAVGDGSVYDPQPKAGLKQSKVWRKNSSVRREYGRSVQYSLTSLITYMQKYADKNTVLIFLGDHQASSIVSGDGASHDVPITIVAHDPAVLDRISGWGWTEGLKPDPKAPVWPMSAFRDKFLTAFGPQGGTATTPTPTPSVSASTPAP